MNPILSLISETPYISLPPDLIGWFGFFALLSLILLLQWKWRSMNETYGTTQWGIFITLLVLAPLTSLFIGVRLSAIQTPGSWALLPQGMPMEPTTPAIMIFSAVPWVLAAGLLGPLAAGVTGLVSGSVAALWQTHTLFTPLEIALLATLMSAALRQQYRTTVFRLLRHPIASAILLAVFYPFLHLTLTTFITRGLLVTRLDYALTNLEGIALTATAELLVAGLIAELVAVLLPSMWRKPEQLVPSPAERSLRTRFLVSLAPLAMILVLTLMAADWIIAGQAAQSMLRFQMESAANTAANGVPFYLEIGQNLASQVAKDPRVRLRVGEDLEKTLEQSIKDVPFFNQLTVLDDEAQILATHPSGYYSGRQAPVEEQMGIQMALNGVPIQIFTIPPSGDQTGAQISFITAIEEGDGNVDRVLVARSDMTTNPYAQSFLTGLTNLNNIDGQGMLIDENNQILIHPDPERIMHTYLGRSSSTADYFSETAPDGTRQMVYYQPVNGRPWSIVLTVPAYRTQQIAMSIALPLLGIILILSLVGIILVQISLSAVTHSLQTLAGEAGRLADGKLDQPVTVESVDEVGQLGRSFEQMRLSLKNRLDELNRLLQVSQGVASSLEISEAVQPILESALASGACSARIILSPQVMPELGGDTNRPVRFGYGPSQNLYRDLDEQILALTRQQDRLVLSNLLRPRLLNVTPGAPRPESLIAVALRHENNYYGALWVAYDQPHTFSEEEVRFIVTLGGQAALAAANTRLFMNAEIGRRRLESILASSPDPVLVTDQRDRLLLTNPAAWQVLGLSLQSDEGEPIDTVIKQSELVELLRSSSEEMQSTEINLPGGRIFLATATSVLAEGQQVGRVCVLRDVTHFKELDSLKSEFVSTVSHDLRSPLTLMRGYATMLEMVGQLNEQQTTYVRKIVNGVESMTRLVNNLLDLGRIEAGIGLQVEIVPVQDIVERVVNALQLQAAQKHIHLSADILPQSIPLIEADQALLQQALHNLVENAIKYSRPEGKVLMRVQTQPIGIVFQVADNGIGISPMDLPRVFEKFYRGVQQTSKDQRGSGLGLAIVKSIAERHGGRVWAESQLGKGSTFYIAIPPRQPR
jgi:two-component system, OmpR family, phosphate regulon sensor histidine kinase PhoR